MSAGPIDSSKPSVAFLIDRWDPERGGAERAMAQFAEHMLARGYRVLAVACEHAEGAPGEVVRVSTSGITRSAREKRLARKLVAAARAHGADVTVGCRHLYECDLYWPHGGAHRVTLAALGNASMRRPGAELRGRHATFVDLERELLERGGARRVACASELVLDELAAEYPTSRDRLVLVENGVDLRSFDLAARATTGAALRAELEIADRTPLIAFSARNPMLKGLAQLGGVLGAMAARTPALDAWRDVDWRLLVAGADHSHWRWPDLLADFGSRVTWRRHVDPVALWSAADLCVHPTWRDTFGLGIVEALACGTPVVTTELAGACAFVSDAAGAVVRAPDQIDALHTAISAWLDRIRRGDVDRAAIRRCVEHLDIAKMHARLEALVIELARRGP